MVNKIEELKKARDSILPEARFWNRQKLFLAWAFCAAIILTTGIELAKAIAQKYVLWGILFLFVFALIIIWPLTKRLNEATYYSNKTYEVLTKEIEKLERES